MQKKVLSEIALYYGEVSMPKGFEIQRDVLTLDIFVSHVKNSKFEFSKVWDMLNTYVKDYVNVKHKISLVNKETWGNFYKPNETTAPLLNVDPVDLRYSPDFTLLYGVKVEDCSVTIDYDDNRRKGRSWNIELTNNKFVMFPSINSYYITNKQKDSLNFIQTITYEYI